jgi:predicted RNase H-like HicB family nuclease
LFPDFRRKTECTLKEEWAKDSSDPIPELANEFQVSENFLRKRMSLGKILFKTRFKKVSMLIYGEWDMKKIIQVKIYKGEKYYVAECLDLPVVTQGKTLDEVVKNIDEAISLHLEGEDLTEWDILPDFSILVNLELPSYVKA